MYCRKCGKEIDYDAPLCKECQQNEEFFGEPEVQPARPLGSRKEGFGGALTATILGGVAFFVAIMAMTILAVSLEEASYGYYDTEGTAVAVTFLFMAVGLAVPALILGIKGMRCFFSAKNAGRIKPIPTLVLGIVGIAMSALSFLYDFLTLIMLAVI